MFYSLSKTYDLAGRLASVTLGGGREVSVTAYQWNAPTAITYPGGLARSYGYDGFLRLEAIKASEATGQTLQDYAYAYRPSGNIASITKADGRATDGTTLYGYDALYRLKTVSGPESTEDYTYDPLGNRRTASGVTGPTLRRCRVSFDSASASLSPSC